MDVLGRYSYDVQGIPKDEVLLQEVLKRRGYRTGIVGKWHLGGTTGYLPNDRGFDSFYGALWSNDDQPYAIYGDRAVAVPAPANQDTLTHDFTQAATEFIISNQTSPVLPIPGARHAALPGACLSGFPGEVGGRLLTGDAAMELDWSVGEILGTLKQLGLDEKTLVIFTSDNGPWMEGNPGSTRGEGNCCVSRGDSGCRSSPGGRE